MNYHLPFMLFCFFVTQTIFAEPKQPVELHISAPVWPGFTNADSTGAYVD